MNTKRMNKPMNSLSWSRVLRTLCLIVLVWASLASAFSQDLITAALEVRQKGLDADPKSLALVLQNNEKLNLMGLVGEKGGGISKEVYQANQMLYARVNHMVCKRVMDHMGLEGDLPPIKLDYEPGTDTDLNIKFKDGRPIRVRDLQNVRFSYNDKYPQIVWELTGERLPSDKNYCAINQTDPMPDASRDPKTGKMKYTDEAEFGQIAKSTNEAGGLMYRNPKAVEVELNINKPGYKVSLDRADGYVQEMVENLDKKVEKMEFHQVKQTEFESYHKKAVDPEIRTKLDLEIKETKAHVQLDQSMAGKYMKRLENLDNKLRKQGNLFPKDHPDVLSKIDSESTKELSALSDKISKFKRGPDTADLAAEIGAKQLQLKEHYVKNLSKTYAEMATTAKDPKLRTQYLKSAVDMADKQLGADGRQALKDNVTKIYGADSAVVKELDQEIIRVAGLKKRQAFSDTMMPVATGAMGVADFVNDAFDVYDAYKQGGIEGVAMQQGVKLVAGKVIGYGMSKFIAAVPAAGPYITVAGTGMVSYEFTRNVMKRVTIGGKTLDEHTQEGFENVFFDVAKDKEARDKNLIEKLDRLLENEKFSLPEGMSRDLAIKQVLYNADQGGPLYSFLDGAPEPPKKIVKKIRTLDDIPLEDIEGKTPEEIELDNKITQDLIRLLKGKYVLPAGMTKAQARKLALLNDRAGKPRFGFLIDKEKDKEKRREAQRAAFEKWKNEINPALPYQFISFRDQSFEMTRDGLLFQATAIWSVDKRSTWPEGNLSLYRDGELVAQAATAGLRSYGKYEPDPMNKKKWLLSVAVKITEAFAGPYDSLLPPETYYYSMVWHLTDDGGQPKSVLGSTEQAVTYGVFPRPNSKPQILFCKEDGQSLNDDEPSKRLQAHLAAHFHALEVDRRPSRFMADVDVYQMELPARLYSIYSPFSDGHFSLNFYSEGTLLGSRTFDAQGQMIAQNFNRVGLVYGTSHPEIDGMTALQIQETWYDQQHRKHGPARVLISGEPKLDEFYKHGQKHGEQVRADGKGHVYAIETYKDGKRHGLYETFHSDNGTPTGVTAIRTQFQEGVEAGPHETFYTNGGKRLYEEYDIQDGRTVKHGRLQAWNEQGKLVKDEQYRSGELHGQCMYYSDGGDILRETHYHDGLRQGEERIYFENTRLKFVVSYEAGKAEGIGMLYHQSGKKVAESLYRNGERLGDLKRWASYQKPADWTGSNDLVYEARYDDNGYVRYVSEVKGYYGEPEARWEYEYAPKGDLDVLRWVCSADGRSVKHGFERCYVRGQKVLEKHWDMGEEHGTFGQWYVNGQAQELEEYKAGERHGKRMKWDSFGNVILSETYKNGLLTGERIELGKNSYYDPRFETTHYEIKDGKSVPVPGWRIWQEVKLVDGKYVPHGKTEEKVDGQIVLTKNYNNGQEAGEGVQVLEDGSIEIKRVVDGKLDGSYSLRDADGHFIKTGYYSKGEPTKEEEYGENENGLFYRKSTYDIIDGKAVEKTRQLIEYRGQPSNYHGVYEIHQNGQLTRKTTYRDKVKHGPYSEYYDNGKPKETGTYLNGKWHGIQRQFDEQGNSTRETEYDNGLVIHAQYLSRSGDDLYVTEQNNVIIEGQTKPHGKQTRKKNDKMLSVETYDQGVRHGETARWDEDGRLTFQEIYDQGVVVSATKFSGSGDRILKSEANWVNRDGKPVLHGVQRRYVNDQIVAEETYSLGQKTGMWKKWGDTGTPLLLESYDDQSRKHGTWKQWNEAGTLLLEASYLAGQYHGPYRSYTDKGIPKEAIDYEVGKKRQQVSYDTATGTVRRMTLYDANENKLKEASYYTSDGKLSRTIASYVVVDGKSVYHGLVQRFVDDQLQSEDTYDKGVRTASFYCSDYEGKRYMTWSTYVAQGDESVRHGVTKQYCEGDLVSEEVYDHGQLTQRISTSTHEGVVYKTVTPQAVFDGKTLSHGVAKVYRDGVFSQESHYEKGNLVQIVSFGQRDGKPLKTVSPYIQVDGKSVVHGIVKRYLEGKLIEEIEYQNGKEVK